MRAGTPGILVLCIAALLAAPGVASAAEVPQIVAWDGVLFAEGACCGYSYSGPVTFRLFDKAVAGKNWWTETHEDVVVTEGVVHVDLGSVTPFDAFSFNGPRWLEIELGGGIGVLSPRVRLGAAPWAIQAQDSLTLAGRVPEYFAASIHQHQWGDIFGDKPEMPPVAHTHDDRYRPRDEADGLYASKGMEAKVAAMQAALDTLQATVAAQGQKLDEQAGLLATLTTRHDALEATVAGQTASLADHAARIASLEADVLVLQGAACPADMAIVGDGCVDRVEASVWEYLGTGTFTCAALQEAVDAAVAAGWTPDELYAGTHASCSGDDRAALCDYRQYGSPNACADDLGCDDYPALFPDSGNRSVTLYACAVRGVMPSRSLTWFQAVQACAASGRHLVTNAEWQAAVAGTLDPGFTALDDGRCRTFATGPRVTGQGSALCTSAYGVEDAIGNVAEWVAWWGISGPIEIDYSAGYVAGPWPAGFSGEADACENASCDATWNVNGQASTGAGYVRGLPFGAIRGGHWLAGPLAGAFELDASLAPSTASFQVGFRCARSR